MRSISKGWQQYWFEPAGPEPLAFCRILFFATLTLHYALFDVSAWGDVDPVFWKPVLLFRVFELPLLSSDVLIALQGIWKLALVTSCLGILTRTSTWIAWGLGIYLLGLNSCFGKISHHHQIVVLVLGIMALSCCGDVWSLDACWMPHRIKSRQPEISASGGYTWPVRLTWLIFINVFFAAGIFKLRVSGLSWFMSDNLANVLIRAHYGIERTWNTLGLEVARHAWLCRWIAASVLVLELISPLALVSRRARRLIIPALLLMQSGIFVLMGTNFVVFFALYVFWIPDLFPVKFESRYQQRL